MEKKGNETINREILYGQEMVNLAETLGKHGVPFSTFIRGLEWRHLLKDGDYRSEVPMSHFCETNNIPYFNETVMVSTSLFQQKIADDVLAGSEVMADWRQMAKIVDMDASKIEIPIRDRADFQFNTGGQRAPARSMGGQIPSAELDASNETGMYRGAIDIPKHWIRDSNFNAIQETLTTVGEAVSVKVQKVLIDALISNASQTDTKANVDGTNSIFMEAFINVIDNLIPSNKFYCDTAVFHPADFAAARYEASAAAGGFPWLQNFYQDKVGGATGLKFGGIKGGVDIIIGDADAATENTVMFYNKNKYLALGIRQDLTIEDFDDVREGIEGAAVTMQFVTAELRDLAAYKVTSW